MSKAIFRFTTLAVSTCVLLLTSTPATAKIKKIYHPVESSLNLAEPFVKSHFALDLDMAVLDHNLVTLPSLWGQYKALNFLAIGLGFSYAISDEGDTLPGNVYFKLKSSLCSNKKSGWNACLAGQLGASISVQDLADDDTTGAHMAAVGMVVDQNLLRFMPEASVFEPSLVASINNGALSMLANLGVAAGTPMSGPTKKTVTGLTYGFEINTGMGDHRGRLEWAIGGKGMADINGLGDNMFAFVSGLRLKLHSTGLYPYLRVLVPIAGDQAGVNAVATIGLSWNYLGLGR